MIATTLNTAAKFIPVDMKRVGTIVLGGGEGKRLFPLTSTLSKPALMFGGKWRLIDFPLSNAINSECRKIFIITQYLASSLHEHITKTYRQDHFSQGFIELLSSEQKLKRKEWYQGTADAVRQNLDYFLECPVEYFLILSGDQIYNIDFKQLVSFAQQTDADLVIASLAVQEKEAKRMGLLKSDENGRVISFFEKPQKREDLDAFKINDSYLGSMGIYLFKRDVLFKLLENSNGHDFGKDLIPEMIAKGNTSTYIFDTYWEDIGTIESFYKANINLTCDMPLFNGYNEISPIYNSHVELPGPKFYNCKISNSIINAGSLVSAKEISHSVLGLRSVIGEGTVIKNSYLMGNDFYHPPVSSPTLPLEIGIGKRCLISNAIIDRNVFIGDDVSLTNENQLDEFDSDGVYIRDGIIIVTRGATIPPHFKL